MIVSLLFLILLLPLACLRLALNTFFTPSALDEMGICLNDHESTLGPGVSNPSSRGMCCLLKLPAIGG